MKGNSITLLAGWLTLLGAFVSASAAEDWPQFRGPTGQGLAGKIPRSWGADKGVAWKIAIDEQGWSSPVMSGGKLILTGATGEGEDLELHVVARDVETGDPVWSRKVFKPTLEEVTARHGKNSFASATPLIHEGIIYAHFGHMGTVALKLDSGEEIWRQKVVYKPKHGGASSPIWADGLIVFSMDGEEDPALMALHADSGKVAWKTMRNTKVKQQFSFATPLLVEHEGEQVIVSPASGMIGGYSPKDGSLVWTVDGGKGFSVVPRPVKMGGVVYAATGFMKPRLLAIKLGGKGEVSKSHVSWEVEKFIPKTPSFVAADGVVYVLDDTGSVSCIDALTGELRWREKLMGNFSASPILAGGALYCCTEDGVCFVLEVSPEAGKVVFEFDLEERMLSSPVGVDGALFLRTETHLWKIAGE